MVKALNNEGSGFLHRELVISFGLSTPYLFTRTFQENSYPTHPFDLSPHQRLVSLMMPYWDPSEGLLRALVRLNNPGVDRRPLYKRPPKLQTPFVPKNHTRPRIGSQGSPKQGLRIQFMCAMLVCIYSFYFSKFFYSMLYYILSHYIISYSIILYCTGLYSTALYCTLLDSTVLYCSRL